MHLLCRYEVKPGGNAYGGNRELLIRGTGTIVSTKGHILTVRHLVDPSWALVSYPDDKNADFYRILSDNFLFKECDAAPPSADTLPTPEQIRALNPSTAAAPARYTAGLYFIPSQGDLSEDEYKNLDFAILTINRSINCSSAACALPEHFPATPLLLDVISGTAGQNLALVSYGYPVEVLGGFSKADLKGVVGSFDRYYRGDKYFADTPLLFRWTATDAGEGRSGSPIFFKNRVVGIELGADPENVTIDYGLGVPAISRMLRDAGLENILNS
ncbi:MAG: trypsin-like peptidase domain-containing protein [Patescibacteria group bacterium]